MIKGATIQRAKALIPVKPNRLFTIMIPPNPSVSPNGGPQPYKPSQICTIRPAWKPTQPSGATRDERRDDPRAALAEHRAGQQAVRLAGARAQISGEHRIGDIEAEAEDGDPDYLGQAVSVVELKAQEQEREPGREGGPQTGKVPQRSTPVERHDPRVARGVVVLDRLVQDRVLNAQVLEVARGRFTMSVAVISRPGVHARSFASGPVSTEEKSPIDSTRLDRNVIGSSPAILKAMCVRPRMVGDLTCQERGAATHGAGEAGPAFGGSPRSIDGNDGAEESLTRKPVASLILMPLVLVLVVSACSSDQPTTPDPRLAVRARGRHPGRCRPTPSSARS